MVAPVACGTLAGSTSGSWASIHKKPPAATARASVETLRSYGSHNLTLPTVADSDVPVGHNFRNREKQQREIGGTGVARFVR